MEGEGGRKEEKSGVEESRQEFVPSLQRHGGEGEDGIRASVRFGAHHHS